jgi:hypothetical protein
MAKKQQPSPKAAGIAGAVVSSATMLLLGIGGNVGLYQTAAQEMAKWHMFFDLSLLGIITGMLESAFWSFVIIYAFVWVYNKVSKI